MANWTLERITSNFSNINSETFGHNFHVTFRMKYTASFIGKFIESPSLDWHEKIMMKEHHKNEYWEFETNMFAHNSSSNTLLIWPRRYVEAYNKVFGLGKSVIKGNVAIYKISGVALTKADLGNKQATTNKDKADVIRNYLKSKGGVLEIEVHDVPAINKPQAGDNEHKERLLLFDCGLVGGSLRVKAMQYLNVDSAIPAINWKEEFKTSTFARMNLDTGGFNRVPPPPLVSNVRPANLLAGEFV